MRLKITEDRSGDRHLGDTVSWEAYADLFALAFAALVGFYRWWSPRRYRGRCIYEPTCSAYALLALRKHGFFGGLRLILDRMQRCGRGGKPGVDYP